YNFADATLNTNDTASLWVNPASSAFGASEANVPATTLTGGLGADRIAQAFNINVRGVNDPTKYVDDIRVGTTWASVAPIVWTGTNASYGTAGNWATGSVPADGASLNPSFYDVAGVSHTVTLGSNRNLGGLTLNSASGFTFNNAGGETL